MLQSQNDNFLKKSAAVAGVSLAIMLICLKFFAFLKTDSLAIFSSLADSVTDLFASMVSFIAVYFSTKPASKNHRYGYGKTEALSAFLQAIFVGASGVFVIVDGIKRLISPVTIEKTDVGIFIMLFSIFATVILVLFQTYVANKTNSLAIKADRAHYTVDFLTNSAVVISLLMVHFFGFVYFDVIAALFISVYLLYNAYELASEAIEQITDKELSPEIRQKIQDIVSKSQGIHGMHDLRTRSLGDIYCIELHLEIDGKISLFEAHEYADAVEHKIMKEFPGCQVIIHQDPYGIHEDRLDHQIEGSCQL